MSRMEVYLGTTLALTVANIGVATGLEVDGDACRSLPFALNSRRAPG